MNTAKIDRAPYHCERSQRRMHQTCGTPEYARCQELVQSSCQCVQGRRGAEGKRAHTEECAKSKEPKNCLKSICDSRVAIKHTGGSHDSGATQDMCRAKQANHKCSRNELCTNNHPC
eukprot:4397045-Karenia_brevis.AAC.1